MRKSFDIVDYNYSRLLKEIKWETWGSKQEETI